MSAHALPQRRLDYWGTVTEVTPGMIRIRGASALASVGNEISIRKDQRDICGEVLAVNADIVTALLYESPDEIRIGDKARIHWHATVSVSDDWLGNVVNYRGEISGQLANAAGGAPRRLLSPAPEAHLRRPLGPRVPTGHFVTDALLPICRGQRIGLFAGSGVGKSTFLGSLASGMAADRIVVALVGERSREVNDFVKRTLPPHVLERSVVVAATSSEPPGAKKRAAYCAMAAAEHFRDEGHHVLLLVDSVTRLAEAHREMALMAGETPALNAFPPSTARIVSEFAERAGPGSGSDGDITAVFSVLVSGSDMEEPVADMVRGILDGHFVLSREIAERGRYPAIDVLRSVSRSLPAAATLRENALISKYRKMITTYEEVLPMLRASLFEFGKDAEADRAIALFPALDALISEDCKSPEEAFRRLEELIGKPEASSDKAA